MEADYEKFVEPAPPAPAAPNVSVLPTGTSPQRWDCGWHSTHISYAEALAQETAPGDWLWAHPDYEKWKQDSHIRFDWGEVVAFMREYSDSRTASLRADLEILGERGDLEKMRADIAEEQVARLQAECDKWEEQAKHNGQALNHEVYMHDKHKQEWAETVARLEKERDWIPTSERLPEVGGTYLVCRKFVEPFAWQVDLGHFFLLETGPTWMDAGIRAIEVQHWMELPKSPAAEARIRELEEKK